MIRSKLKIEDLTDGAAFKRVDLVSCESLQLVPESGGAWSIRDLDGATVVYPTDYVVKFDFSNGLEGVGFGMLIQVNGADGQIVTLSKQPLTT